nr:hypothetical protein [uncultured Bacteroides sp.]
MKKQNYISVLSLLILLILCSCIEDDNLTTTVKSGEETYSVTYRISTRSSSDANASDNEMMKSILLFVVNANNKIEKKVTETFQEMKKLYEIKIQLTPGTKTVYGFSNLSASNLTEAGLANLEIGNTMPDLTNSALTIANGFTIDAISGNYLPMSNKTTFTVTNIANQSFNMELIRMLCKMKLNFKNESGHSITLKDIVLSPVTTSAIYLLPRSNGLTAPALPVTKTTGNYTYTFNSSSSFADKAELKDYIFYFNESQVNNNGWFKLTLNAINGTDNEVRMSLTDLTFINRNDYLPLNIILTDYKLELDLKSYPPIGGYAAAVSTTTDGYRCTFPGGGPFVITPKLVQLSSNSVITDANWSFTYTDASSIFDKVPTLNNGEIKGTLKSSATGTALCTISVNVSTSENITRMLSYRVYISQN